MKHFNFKSLTLLLLLLVVGVGQMWAWDLNGHMYFDNSTKKWNEVTLLVGNDNGSLAYNFTRVENTNLFYKQINHSGYGDMYFVNKNLDASAWWSGYDCCRPYARAIECSDYWGPYKKDYKDSKSWYFDGIDNSKSASDGIPTPQATIRVKVRPRGEGAYTNLDASPAPATITLQGTHMTGNGTTGRNTVTWNGDKNYNVVMSGKVTTTYADLDERYIFDGWEISDKVQSKEATYEYYQTVPTTVVAKFTRVKYAVTFNKQSGEGGTDNTVASDKQDMPEITIPTRTGYTFDGYYTEQNGAGKKYYNADGTSAKTCDLKDDITLYANWTPTIYTITYNQNGGTGATNGNYTIESETITLPTAGNMTKVGHRFMGWYGNSGLTGDPVTTIEHGSTGDKEFWAKWEELTCVGAVTYDISCWNTGDIETSTEKDGLTIVGTSDNKVQIKTVENGIVISNKNFTQVAKLGGMANATYRYMSFDVTGPCRIDVYLTSSSASESRTLKMYAESWGNGDPIHGFAATGGSKNKESFTYKGSATTLVLGSANSGIDVYGIDVTPVTLYSLTYSVENKTEGSVPAVEYLVSGENVTLNAATGFSRIGYTFNKWNDGSADYAAGADYTMPGNNVTMTATWTPITYVVTYDANGGEGVTMASTNHTYDEGAALSSNTYTRAGYIFAGWDTEVAGTNVVYTNGQSVSNLTTTNGATVNLYAVWTPRFRLVGSDNSDNPKGMPGWSTGLAFTTLDATHFACEVTLEANTWYKFKINDTKPTKGLRGCTATGDASNMAVDTRWKLDGSNDVHFQTGHAGVYVFNLTIDDDDPSVKWYDKKYAVTVNNGEHGIVSPNGTVQAGAIGVQLTVIPNAGYAHLKTNWNVTGGASVSENTEKLYATADGTATATYTAINYSITYHENNGGWISEFVAPSSFTIESSEITLPTSENISRTGYTFGGWFNNESCEGDAVVSIEAGSTENKEYWAKWNENLYTVTIATSGDQDGGHTNVSGEQQVGIVSVAITATPADGYVFRGWTTTGGASVAANTASTTMTATAIGTITAKFCREISLSNITSPYYIYAGETLDLPTTDANGAANIVWSGSSKLTDNHYTCSVPHNSTGLVATATSTCDGSYVVTQDDIAVRTYKYMIKYKNNKDYSQWHIYWMTPVGNGDYYWHGTYSGSTSANIIANYKKADATDGSEFNDLTYLGDAAMIENITTYGDPTVGSQAYFIYTPGDARTNGSFAIYGQPKVTLAYDPANKYTHFPMLALDATVTPVCFDASEKTTTLEYSTNGTEWHTWSDSYTPTAAGTYHFRAKVSGKNAIGQAATNVTSNVVEVVISDITFSLGVTSSHGTTGEPAVPAIYPNSTITLTPNIGSVAGGTPLLVCYEYTTKPDGAVTSFSQDGATNAISTSVDKVGDYTVTATLKYGSDCSSATEIASTTASFTMRDNYVTLTPNSVNNVNGTLVLTAQTNLDNPTYSFTVIRPGESQPIQIGTTNPCNYTLPMAGTYEFRVHATEGDVNLDAAVQNYEVYGKTMYMRYCFYDDRQGEERRYRCNVKLSYNAEDGSYYYYQDHAVDDGEFFRPVSSYQEDWDVTYGTGKHDGRLAWVGTTNVGSDPSTGWIEIINPERLPNSTDAVIFHYSPDKNEVWITSATPHYRVKSVGSNGTFYSNAIKVAEDQQVSFYASTDATLTWQTSTNGLTWDELRVTEYTLTPTTEITANGIYNVTVDFADNVPAATQTLTKYSGKLYVSSPALGGKTAMTSFTKDAGGYFDRYCVDWAPDGTDVGAMVGNDINKNLAVLLPQFNLPSGANVRYAYDTQTNHFSRSFVAGSTAGEFLKVFGANVTKTDGTTPANNLASGIRFSDVSDWVYVANIKASKGAAIEICSSYEGKDQYLLSPTGAAGATMEILGSQTTTEDKLSFLVSYDYKTNKVVAAWNPKSTDVISSDLTIDADLLVVRSAENKNNPEIFQLTNNATVNVIRRIVFALRIDRADMFNHDKSAKEGLSHRLFQICLPYDVNMMNIYGIEDYGNKWEIQNYAGEKRAAQGWQSYIEDFWTMIGRMSLNSLKANRGYVVSANLEWGDFNEIGTGEYVGDVEQTIARKYLYFPSATKAGGWTIDDNYGTSSYPEIACMIPGREEIDANWRMMGTPGFYAASSSASIQPIQPVYKWNGDYGSYTTIDASTTTLEPTKAYLAQFYGDITWNAPAAVAARQKAAAGFSKYRIDLVGADNTDPAFVVLSEDGTEGYEMNKDLTKLFTDGISQIYTTSGDYELASNVLDEQTTMVEIGLSIPNEAAEYSFHLGYMNSGAQTPYLYDAENGTYTNLATTDYTFVADRSGKQHGRFFLVFGYQAPDTTTGMNNTLESNEDGIQKFLYNGILYILRDGKLYDAQGRVTK